MGERKGEREKEEAIKVPLPTSLKPLLSLLSSFFTRCWPAHGVTVCVARTKRDPPTFCGPQGLTKKNSLGDRYTDLSAMEVSAQETTMASMEFHTSRRYEPEWKMRPRSRICKRETRDERTRDESEKKGGRELVEPSVMQTAAQGRTDESTDSPLLPPTSSLAWEVFGCFMVAVTHVQSSVVCSLPFLPLFFLFFPLFSECQATRTVISRLAPSFPPYVAVASTNTDDQGQ